MRQQTKTQNRLLNILESYNIKLRSVVSSIKTKSAMAITHQKIIATPVLVQHAVKWQTAHVCYNRLPKYWGWLTAACLLRG